MNELRISRDLALPLETVTQAIAILAKRRSGKSFTARKLVEGLSAAGQQVVIVDPKGDWWGIRSSADGKRPGLPFVILGGERGDAPLEAGAGEVVAQLVVEERVSLLLNLAPFRKHERSTFMTAFLETVYRMKEQDRYRTPMMLVIDEADQIAPQKPEQTETRMLGAADDIVRLGGQRGLGCTLVTQRTAVLNKNVLTQCELLIALRTISPQDRDAIERWIEAHGTEEQRDEFMATLPGLPVGDAWFWAPPGWPDAAGLFKRTHVLPIDTFDSGATPKPGERRIQPHKAATVDLEALRQRMAATIERAKADDPKELRKKITALERELAAKPGKVAPMPKTVEKLIVSDRQLEQLAKMLERGRGLAEVLEKLVADARVVAGAPAGYLRPTTESVMGSRAPRNGMVIDVAQARAIDDLRKRKDGEYFAAQVRPDGAKKLPAGGESVPPARQRILDALAWLESVRLSPAEKTQLAFLADASPTSSSYQHNLGAMRSAQLIDYVGSRVALTHHGRALANPTAAPTSSHELQQLVLAKLAPARRRILTALLDHPAAEVSKTELAERVAMSPTSSSFQHHLGNMRSLGLIDYPSNGTVRAQPVLFLEGR